LKSLVDKFESAQLFKEGRRREMRLNMELQAVAGSRNDLFVFSVFDKIDSNAQMIQNGNVHIFTVS